MPATQCSAGEIASIVAAGEEPPVEAGGSFYWQVGEITIIDSALNGALSSVP